MQNSTDGFMLGIKELELYDNLIKQYINFGREFVSPEQIDDLFPEDEPDVPNPNPNPNDDPDPNDDPNSSGNGGEEQQEDPSNLTVNKYIITNIQDSSPYAIVKEYHDNTLVRTTNITSIYPYTDINNHLSFRSKGAYAPGEMAFYIYTLVKLTWNGSTYNANQSISEYGYRSENTVIITS